MKPTRIHFAVLLFWLSILLSQSARGADPVLLGQWPGYPREGGSAESVQVVERAGVIVHSTLRAGSSIQLGFSWGLGTMLL